MKLSPFTLIYGNPINPEESTGPESAVTPGKAGSKKSSIMWDEVEGLEALPESLSRTLKLSAHKQQSVGAKGDPVKKLKAVVKDLNRSDKVLTVALWDLDAGVSGLSQLIEPLNSAQTAFTFFDFRAPVPAGLVIKSNMFAKWARKRLGKLIPEADQGNIKNNFMFDDFHKFAKVVRERIGVDYLVGITQYMLAWKEQDKVYWNYFTTYDGRIIMVSAFDMRRYAKRAGRPVEAAIAGLAVSQLLQILNRKLAFHENRTKPCMFDFNEDRDSIARALKHPRIDPECLDQMNQPYREAAEKIVAFLKNYSPVEDPVKKQAVKSSGKNDEYWLKRLNTLGSEFEKGSTS